MRTLTRSSPSARLRRPPLAEIRSGPGPFSVLPVGLGGRTPLLGCGRTHAAGLPKANPREPIEVNPSNFRQLPQVLIKRSHSVYLACFQPLVAENRPISANFVWPRTTIRTINPAWLPIPRNEPGMSCGFNGIEPKVLSQALGEATRTPGERSDLNTGLKRAYGIQLRLWRRRVRAW